jgi:O-glycosyl hydrolase
MKKILFFSKGSRSDFSRLHRPVLMTSMSFLLSGLAAAQTVNVWMTAKDQSLLLQQQPSTVFSADPGSGSIDVNIDESATFQSMDGFGFTLTEGSAEAIHALTAAKQDELLNDIFGVDGISSQVARISIGASDLSSSSYSYNGIAGDVLMNNFSLDGPDRTFLIPVLKKIISINPSIKIIATPWSAPPWMKTNNSTIGGSLLPKYYPAYALYFVKYLDAMRAEGIEICAVTPQNEPENPGNEPSMTMNAYEQYIFIDRHLGPAVRKAGYGVKIISFDHNCDNTDYPTQVCNASSYVDGAAFHLYAGPISALSTVRNSTGKNVYFTEQYTSSTGSFSGDFPWHMQNVIFGAMNNWAKAVLEWNLANDQNIGPHTAGGCTTCLGAVTIDGGSGYTRNVSYYLIGQESKFVKSGAIRISSSSTNKLLLASAFKNPDGTVALVVYNISKAASIKVNAGASAFVYAMPSGTAATFVWDSAPVVPVSDADINPASAAIPGNLSRQLAVTLSPGNSTNKNVIWSSSDAAVAMVNGNGLVTGLRTGTATITASTEDGKTSATSEITVTSPVQGPYGGEPWAIPGTIEIEKYDLGGENIAYHDADTLNNGAKFRITDAVDIEKCSSGGFDVGWLVEGEWMEYTVDVLSADNYTIDARVASEQTTGAFHVEFNGVDKTGLMRVPNTQGSQKWEIVSRTGISLNAGQQIMRISLDGSNFNFDKITLSGGSVGVEDKNMHSAKKITASIWPNPVTDTIHIRLSDSDDCERGFVLYNVLGQQVFHENTKQSGNQMEIDLPRLNLPNGIYFLKIKAGSEQFLKKIILAR